mmetsp:Transcript_3067/g.4734  ORF Transcript_3067/g.4734 Transcript_3067/m.4734 type:complete len:107 (+) Transcript_3067:9-329(+)
MESSVISEQKFLTTSALSQLKNITLQQASQELWEYSNKHLGFKRVYLACSSNQLKLVYEDTGNLFGILNTQVSGLVEESLDEHSTLKRKLISPCPSTLKKPKANHS